MATSIHQGSGNGSSNGSGSGQTADPAVAAAALSQAAGRPKPQIWQPPQNELQRKFQQQAVIKASAVGGIAAATQDHLVQLQQATAQHPEQAGVGLAAVQPAAAAERGGDRPRDAGTAAAISNDDDSSGAAAVVGYLNGHADGFQAGSELPVPWPRHVQGIHNLPHVGVGGSLGFSSRHHQQLLAEGQKRMKAMGLVGRAAFGGDVDWVLARLAAAERLESGAVRGSAAAAAENERQVTGSNDLDGGGMRKAGDSKQQQQQPLNAEAEGVSSRGSAAATQDHLAQLQQATAQHPEQAGVGLAAAAVQPAAAAARGGDRPWVAAAAIGNDDSSGAAAALGYLNGHADGYEAGSELPVPWPRHVQGIHGLPHVGVGGSLGGSLGGSRHQHQLLLEAGQKKMEAMGLVGRAAFGGDVDALLARSAAAEGLEWGAVRGSAAAAAAAAAENERQVAGSKDLYGGGMGKTGDSTQQQQQPLYAEAEGVSSRGSAAATQDHLVQLQQATAQHPEQAGVGLAAAAVQPAAANRVWF